MCGVSQMALVICGECIEENCLEIIYLSGTEIQYIFEVHYGLFLGVRNSNLFHFKL